MAGHPVTSTGTSAPGASATGPGVRTTTLCGPLDGPPSGHHRLDRHLLILVTAGHGRVSLDFVAQPCRPGTLIWARPGQVIRYSRQPGLDAILIGWRADLLTSLAMAAPTLTDPSGGHWQLAGEDEDAVINEVSQLVVDCERQLAGDLPGELLRHQLAVLLLRVAMLPSPGHPPTGAPALAAAESDTFLRLRRAVERSYAATRRVEDYAAALGCSVRTLTRACLAATGRSAKQIIDDRVALQARRLLACTDLPVAEVGALLGFAEPTNFGRFFHRQTGCSPGAFRAVALLPDVVAPAQRRPTAESWPAERGARPG